MVDQTEKTDHPEKTPEPDNDDRSERLIAFFKTIKRKKPRPDQADYASWNQTEEDYQKQQADWMEKVQQKKQQDKKTEK